jgi:hypothetical protein
MPKRVAWFSAMAIASLAGHVAAWVLLYHLHFRCAAPHAGKYLFLGLRLSHIGFDVISYALFGALATSTLLPVAWLVRVPRGLWHRRRTGLCVACGYDLRATPGRCPECWSVETTPRTATAIGDPVMTKSG